MTTVETALGRFRSQPVLPEDVPGNPFKLVSTVMEAALWSEIGSHFQDEELPTDLVELWSTCAGARLFEDVDYGQWGLVLLDPSASASRTARERGMRPDQFRTGDVVVGEFLGDSDLLVLAPSERGQRRVLVALPLDGRSEWFGVGSGLGEFLDDYFDASGEKYWEQ